MNESERAIWSGLEARLDAVEAYVPEPPPWRPEALEDAAVRARVRLGPALDPARAKARAGRRWILLIALLGLVLALVAGAILAGSGQRDSIATLVGRNGMIAFSTFDDPQHSWGIVGVGPRGENPRSLVSSVVSSDGSFAAGGTCPAFSRDGTRLAYLRSTSELVVAAADGTGPRVFPGVTPQQVFGSDGISWSPDGSKIAYLFGGFPEVDVLDIETGSTVRLEPPTIGQVWGVAWSPDGTEVAILGSIRGLLVAVFRAAADGANLRELAEHPIGTLAREGVPRIAWSPDGSTIAYGHHLVGISPEIDDIFLLAADGSFERQLTHSDALAYGVVWNADGGRMAYATRVGDGSGTVMTVRSDGTDPIVVADGNVAEGLVWSPDGSRLLIKYAMPPGSPGQPVPPMQSVAADGSGDAITLGGELGGGCLPSWQWLAP